MTELRDIEHVGSALPDLLATQREALVVLFPEVFTEGKIDFDKLRVALGDMVNDRPDRYSFSWAGKQDAIRLLQQPSRSTLTPDRGGSVDFDASENMYIAGENLETLKMLYKSYFGRVKMIYIDPPYNTGNDFVYPDSYADPLDMYLRVTGQKDTNGNLLTSNPETSGRYHSAWLSMMYPRLFFARQLLREDGVIFVSIDDHEAPNLRLLMNEIFGEENFVGQIAVQLNPRGRHLDRFLAKTHEYVMVYARDHTQQPLYELEKDERMLREYSKADTVGRYRELELRNRNPAFNRRTRPNLYYPIYVESVTGNAALEGDEIHSVEVYPKNSAGQDSCWTWGKDRFQEGRALIVGRQTDDGSWRIFRKDYLIRGDGQTATTLPKALWLDKELNNDYGKKAIQDLFDGETVFDFPKSPALIEKMLRIGTQKNDLVLDFFAGSGTTAAAVLGLNREDGGNRHFICVQLPEPTPTDSSARKLGLGTIAAIGLERLRRLVAKMKRDEQGKLLLDELSEPLGFKLFTMASSNFRPWQPVSDDTGSEAYIKQLELLADPLMEGWKPEDVIYEVLLREGYSLTSQIERVAEITTVSIWQVIDDVKGQYFFICLEDVVSLEMIRRLNLSRDDLFICRDRALDDTTTANLALQCRLKVI